MRFLLIGGNGFIGSLLTKKIQALGHEVGIFSRNMHRTANQLFFAKRDGESYCRKISRTCARKKIADVIYAD